MFMFRSHLVLQVFVLESAVGSARLWSRLGCWLHLFSMAPRGKNASKKAPSKATLKQLQVVTADRVRNDFEVKLEWVAKHLREKPDLLDTVRAVIDAQLAGDAQEAPGAEDPMQKALERNIHLLKDVPLYLRRESLTHACAKVASYWANQSDAVVNCAFIWAAGGDQELKIPRRRLPKGEYLLWYKEKIDDFWNGASPLTAALLENPELCHNFLVGAVVLVPPRDFSVCEADDLITQIRENRPQGRIGDLPKDFQPTMDQIGRVFELRHNEQLDSVVLANLDTVRDCRLKQYIVGKTATSVVLFFRTIILFLKTSLYRSSLNIF